MKSQRQYVECELKDKGVISRNECLDRHITRLASVINTLRKKGWHIQGGKEGNDYVYRATPIKRVEYKVDGEVVLVRDIYA